MKILGLLFFFITNIALAAENTSNVNVLGKNYQMSAMSLMTKPASLRAQFWGDGERIQIDTGSDISTIVSAQKNSAGYFFTSCDSQTCVTANDKACTEVVSMKPQDVTSLDGIKKFSAILDNANLVGQGQDRADYLQRFVGKAFNGEVKTPKLKSLNGSMKYVGAVSVAQVFALRQACTMSVYSKRPRAITTKEDLLNELRNSIEGTDFGPMNPGKAAIGIQ
jgi:hypothetical protein